MSTLVRLTIILIIFSVSTASAGLLESLSGSVLSGVNENSQSSYRGPLFKNNISGIPDTLEIFVIYVEFAEEAPEDNLSTTGTGKFNSGEESSSSLDPTGFRDNVSYLDKHLEFARDYFAKVSEGRLVLRWNFYPRPNSDGYVKNPITMKNRIAAYNPTKSAEEKNLVFFERKANALMSFITESIRKADRPNNDADNPFKVTKSTSSNVFRSYLIFHAGHSGLIDGGKLGQIGADTPNDIIDFFVTKEDFSLLVNLPEENLDNSELPQPGDTLGIPVNDGQDIITEIMVLSETASQDDVNFGINGLLVNQIARQIGMPDTWDRGTGFTQLGYFDLMDVGHLSLFGFVPVFPSAWLRHFMGWDTPVTALPSVGGKAEYTLWSPLANDTINSNFTKILKIPINEREYLLVENRQRALADSVTVHYSFQNSNLDPEFDKTDSMTVHVSYIDTLFLDSICNDEGKDCEPNGNRPRGIITSVSSYDMGLPGSGLAVWHVNEWFIEQTIRFGFVNASDDETSEFLGINMVEADGDLSIGKEGKDQLNQSIFDFGSGSDLLPHVKKFVKETEPDTVWQIDTIQYIGPYGFSNTNSWNDGRSHISIQALLPDIPDDALQPGLNLITGDSIFNYADSSMVVRILWNQNPNIQKPENSNWPVRTLVSTSSQGVVRLNNSSSAAIVSLSDEGYLETWNERGEFIVPALDTLVLKDEYDSLETLIPAGLNRDSTHYPLHSLGESLGNVEGSAVLEDTLLCVLAGNGNLYFSSLNWDSLAVSNAKSHTRKMIDAKGILGPLVNGGVAWILNSDFELVSYDNSGIEQKRIQLPGGNYHALALLTQDGSMPKIALTGRQGFVVTADPARLTATIVKEPWAETDEKFHILTSDFNRDNNPDMLVMGSRGAVAILNTDGTFFPNFPLITSRATQFVDSLGKVDFISQDFSHASLSDINSDGYPEIIFTGPNSVMAMNRKGAILWTFELEKKQNVGFLYSSEKYPATVVGSTPLVLSLGEDKSTVILIASPDGLIWAIDNRGKPLDISSYSQNAVSSQNSGVLSSNKKDWPLSVGGLNLDTTDVPYIHLALFPRPGESGLQLFSQSGTGGIDSWNLLNATSSHESNWLVPGGNLQRQNRFSVEDLKIPEDLTEKSEIVEFHVYPSPIEGASASIHLNLGAPAKKSRLRFYDLSGSVVLDKSFSDYPTSGKQPDRRIIVKDLGADVYTMLMEVWFEDGSKKKKWERVGIIR